MRNKNVNDISYHGNSRYYIHQIVIPVSEPLNIVRLVLSAALVNFHCTGRIIVGPGLDMVDLLGKLRSPPCWPPLMLVTASLLHLQFHLCLSKLPLHLRMRVSFNVSTSRLSRSTAVNADRRHGLRIAQLFDEGTFPDPLPDLSPRPCR